MSAERFAERPFAECEWTTASPVHEVEADALVGGWDRLVLHLAAMHGASRESDPNVWDDGCWQVLLFPRPWSGEGR